MTVLRSFELPRLSAAVPGILVVEDDAVLAHAIASLLEDRYRLYPASSGVEALGILKLHRDINLVLLDYRLPDVSGIEVLRSIKTARPSLPVIFITGYGSEDVAVRAFTTGAREYIRKPFTYADLTAKVEFCLSLASSPGHDRAKRTLIQSPRGPAEDVGPQPRSQNLYRIQRAVKYIEDNFASAVTLEAAARRACISACHFSRVFREVMGMTFRDYLVGLRIEKAKRILGEGRLSVSETGDAVGYDEPAHFVKMFKKRTGCTPTEYRRSRPSTDPKPS